MRSGTLTIAEFADLLRPLRGLATRLALYRENDQWILGVADVHVGASHGLPTWRKYRYRDFAFVARRVQGAEVANWLQHRADELAGFAFTTPELRNVTWRPKSSYPGYDLVAIRRPYIEYAVYGPGRPGNFEGCTSSPTAARPLREGGQSVLAARDSWKVCRRKSREAARLVHKFDQSPPWPKSAPLPNQRRKR